MPEDCLRGFEFKKTTQTEAELRLADEIFSLQTMNRSAEPKQEMTSVEMDDLKVTDWDSNVPPDLSDSFDFLL